MNKHRSFSFLLTCIIMVCCITVISDTDTVQTVCAAAESNETSDSLIENAEVTFSIDAGADITGKNIELYAPAGYDIYYTTDGSDPTIASAKYTNPLSLQANSSVFAAESDNINVGKYKIYEDSTLPKAITLKAIAASPEGTTTPTATRTYFFHDREPVIVIALSTDYSNFLDYNSGIMVKGAYYDAWANTPGANDIIANNEIWFYQGNYTQKGREWERTAAIEIFDELNGKKTYILDNCGIRVRGGVSRMYPQKSFNIYFRDDYGSKELNYALFDNSKNTDGQLLTSYKEFMLRNGGNENAALKFHDSLIQNLAKNLDITTQASRPAVLYINGEYMGIYVLQEKYSDKFLADHYNVTKKNVVLVEEAEIEEGEDEDISLYEDLISYANKDLSDPAVYKEFCSIADVDSMIDYYAVQIYISNADWGPKKNTRLWRVRTPENNNFGDGKWRWILYDTEYSSTLYNEEATSYTYNSFSKTLENDPLFASAMKNSDFQNKFAEKINYLSENTFAPDKAIAEVDRLAALYKPFMSDYYKRFGRTPWEWNSCIDNLKTFFQKRPQFISDAVQNYQP